MISKHGGLCDRLNKAYIFKNGVYFDISNWYVQGMQS